VRGGRAPAAMLFAWLNHNGRKEGKRMGSIPVLVYHRVTRNGEGGPSDFVVDEEIFERQLKYFQGHGYYSSSLKDILSATQRRVPGKRPFLITFDDGYADTLEIAAPLMKKYGYTAIVFIVPNFSLRTNSWDAAMGGAEAKLMSGKQVLSLRAMGFEIGTHSWSHPSLPTLDDPELEMELRKCKAAAEGLLHEPVISIAYPYGDVDERVIRATKGAGYRCAFATNSGPMSFGKSFFRVRRTRIGNSSNSLYLFLKVSGIEKTCRVVRSGIKQVLRGKPRGH
jgi:peptidoglycan/xylan/chitin deacetylase (PgdA/CDA1 family)